MNDVRSAITKIQASIAFAIAVCACLKMFGVAVPIPGSIEVNAVVAAALALAHFPSW